MKIKLLAISLMLVPGLAAAQCSRCVAIYGDTRSDNAAHKQVVDAMVKTSPETVFHDGDMVADSTDPAEWKAFAGIVAPLQARAELFPVIGNHELQGIENYFSFFGLAPEKRWYSVDRAGIHFVVLDVFSPYTKGSPQYDWLENDLKAQQAAAGSVIALTHVPFYSSGHHAGECAAVRNALEPLLVKYGVKAVFSGHDHGYERSFHSGIYYIVTGGGGAPLGKKTVSNQYSQFYLSAHNFVSVSTVDGRILIEALTTDLKVADSFTISLSTGRPAERRAADEAEEAE